jgi:hypothetical protein
VAVLVLLLAVVVALLAVLVAGLLRSHAEIIRSLHELGAPLDPDADASATRERPVPNIAAPTFDGGEPRQASDVAGMSPDGDALSISIVGTDRPTLVAFLTSGCTTCVGFWEAFADVERLRVPGGARLVVVTKGAESESPGRLRRFTPRDVPVVMSSDAWEAFDVPVAPYFAYVDGPTGAVVGEGAANTWDQLTGMMEQALVDAGMDAAPRRRRRTGRERTERVDHVLQSSGIEPGHPSLYPTTVADLHSLEDQRD